MDLQFNADVTSAASRLDIRNTGKKRPAREPGSVDTGVVSSVKQLRIETYDYSGRLTLDQDGGETLLDRYLRLRGTIIEQITRWSQFTEHTEKSGTPPGEAGEVQPVDGLREPLVPGLPEYWNRENTARRIFSLAMMGFEEGTDRTAFADQASAMIKEAYRDVRADLGREFPQVVLDTRDTVLQALEQLKGGASLDSITFDQPD